MSFFKCSSFAVLLITTPAWSQANANLTAREIFFSTAEAKPSAKPMSNVAHRLKVKNPVKPLPGSTPSGEPTVRDPLGSAGEIAHAEATSPDGTPLVSVASIPLGMRYVVLKQSTDRVTDEVDPDSVFHSRDRIQLDVEVNDTGYLYVVNRGSTGTWKMLFPSAETSQGGNHVTRGRQYRIPEKHVIAFDSNPGTEKLFIVFSRQPEADLESLIYSLGNKSPKQPASDKSVQPKSQPGTLMASNLRLDDNFVDGLRRVYSRDLVIEKADASEAESTQADAGKGDGHARPKDHAVYAVNPTGRADSRVVSDVTLIHQ